MSESTGSYSEMIEDFSEAIRLTREYVGYGMLPAMEGWEWYDVLMKHNPEYLNEVILKERKP